MQVLRTIAEVRRWHKEQKRAGREIGFIPTMGYLHEGHLSLARVANSENAAVIMSIFVNPLQFGPQEDYSTYPRDLERDCRLAEGAGVSVVFAPEVAEMYPAYPQLTTVEVQKVTLGLCGASRPGHFTGVATVVSKLFNIVQPDRAYFGQKDYQQVQVLKQMVEDLNMPLEIRMVPIKREQDGLAMSSRNIYLDSEERQQALALSQALLKCQELYAQGEKRTSSLIAAMKQRISQEAKAQIDYIEIRDCRTLEPVSEVSAPAVVALAVKFGKTRLIDNTILGGDQACTGL